MRDIKSTLLYEWFEEVWNNKDKSAISRLMTNEATFDGIPSEKGAMGAPAFELFYEDFLQLFSSIRIDVEDVISQDDMECGRTVIRATHRDTQKEVTVPGICIVKVKNRQITEAWNNYDFLSMQLQLGKTLVDAE